MTALRTPIPLEALLSTLPPNTHLILCHPRPTILSALLSALPPTSPLLTPTLAALATARDAGQSLAFCASVPGLRAHLAALPHASPAVPTPATATTAGKSGTTARGRRAGKGPTTLILADAAALHAPTPAHAVQGLARTLAAAAEAAASLGAALRVVALAGGVGRAPAGDDVDATVGVDAERFHGPDVRSDGSGADEGGGVEGSGGRDEEGRGSCCLCSRGAGAPAGARGSAGGSRSRRWSGAGASGKMNGSYEI
jgi:hypothetical protein